MAIINSLFIKTLACLALMFTCGAVYVNSTNQQKGVKTHADAIKSLKPHKSLQVSHLIKTVGSGRRADSAYKSKGIISPLTFGAKGDGITDDTEAFQKAITAAIQKSYKLDIPSPLKYYKITHTIHVVPTAGAECRLDIEGHGKNQILYTGPANTSCIKVVGVRFSTWMGVKIGLGTAPGLIGIDLDTDNQSHSTSHITFVGCHIGLGKGIGQTAWRLGHVSGGGADISDLLWEGCSVFGNYGNIVSGQKGWHIEGANTLQNVWLNCFGAFLDKMFSNTSGPGATGTGNGACYFFGMGTSQNNNDFDISNAQTYLISGGRFESGKRVLTVNNSNVSPSIIFQGTEINDYGPTDGVLFYLDMPCSLKLDGLNIGSGRHPAYDNRMITCYGGGNGAGIGRVIIDGGAISANKDEFYKANLNKTHWRVYVRGVGHLKGGVCTDMMTDHPGSAE
ncbi:hypothetical protein [Mucilaginibacter lacusdianchii]|uniref:hypothetical protein n=1 Tax=Mucilaginibacter lacusdianchii TaxID=2684211 RepID=UPI00131AC3D7|nr:hypothetical protein [Mucilaginibacter sp. JXJ CY 39]